MSDKEYNIKLKLDNAIDIDAEFIGKNNLEFKILPNSKKVFNIRKIKDGKNNFIELEYN